MEALKTGKNDPCVCGSGKKFRQCCWLKRLEWAKYEPPPVTDTPESKQTVIYTPSKGPTFWRHPPGQPDAPTPQPGGEWVEWYYVKDKGWTHESQLKPGELIRKKGGGWEAVPDDITIQVTDEHPFFVQGRGWTPLRDIRPGEMIRAEVGWIPVKSVESTGRVETVYNLEVEDDHTYFVGKPEWGFSVWAHNMCTPEVEAALLARLKAANIDHDAVNVLAKTARRADVPTTLGDRWAARWDGETLNEFARLSPAERQHLLAREGDAFLQAPSNLAERVRHSAQSPDADLRTAAYLAEDLQDVLTAFGRDVTVPATSQFTGKVKYHPLTDVDVATTKALVEVTNQSNAGGKVAQLAVLLGPEANPSKLPVFHYMPNLEPTSVAAQSLRTAGSAGVYNDRAALVAAIRALQ